MRTADFMNLCLQSSAQFQGAFGTALNTIQNHETRARGMVERIYDWVS
jgi:hypothetical protein